MSELQKGNVQYDDLCIDNIMLHWESNGSVKIGVCDGGCASHTGENVELLWHAETKEAKETLKK